MTIEAPTLRLRTLRPRREAVVTASVADRPQIITEPERQPLPGGQTRLIAPAAGISATALRRAW